MISKLNKRFCILLNVIDIYSKCGWVISSKDKKGTYKIWVDTGSKIYNRSMKSWLQDKDIQIYSTHLLMNDF